MELSMLLLILAGAVPAELPDCSTFGIEVPAEHAVATAATVPNVLGLSESVQVESQRLLTASERRAGSETPPRNPCPAHCALPEKPEILFRSVPSEVLTDYDGNDRCEELHDRTSAQPLTFDGRTFASLHEMSEWVGQFTRGKGEDGAELYRRCDGRCSPSYLWIISRSGGRYVVATEVTCGHARNKESNRYDLSYSLRWTCRPPDVSR
jgi:hypothetical protein